MRTLTILSPSGRDPKPGVAALRRAQWAGAIVLAVMAAPLAAAEPGATLENGRRRIEWRDVGLLDAAPARHDCDTNAPTRHTTASGAFDTGHPPSAI